MSGEKIILRLGDLKPSLRRLINAVGHNPGQIRRRGGVNVLPWPFVRLLGIEPLGIK